MTDESENEEQQVSVEKPKVSLLTLDEPEAKVSILPTNSDEKKLDDETNKKESQKRGGKKNVAVDNKVSGDKYFIESKNNSDDRVTEIRRNRKKTGKINNIRNALKIPALLGLIFVVVQNVGRIDFANNSQFSELGFLLDSVGCVLLTIFLLTKTKHYLFYKNTIVKLFALVIAIYNAYCFFNYHNHLYLAILFFTIASLLSENWALQLAISTGMILSIITVSFGMDLTFIVIPNIDWILFALAFVSFWAVIKHFTAGDFFDAFTNVIQIFASVILLLLGIVIVILSKTSLVQVPSEIISLKLYVTAIISAIVAFIGFADYE